MELKNKKFKTTNIRGKQYVEVAERIKYLAFDFDGDYSIENSYQYFEGRKMWVVSSKLTLIQGDKQVVYTGHAQEIETKSGVNSTSALENAETSAVGRACALAGIGTDTAIASADEMMKAISRESEQESTQQKVNTITEEQLARLRALFKSTAVPQDLKDKYKAKPPKTKEAAEKWIIHLNQLITEAKPQTP